MKTSNKEYRIMHSCSICGYQYEETIRKVPFDKLPDEWRYPVCNALKKAFQVSQPKQPESGK
jgi:rubredoxin